MTGGSVSNMGGTRALLAIAALLALLLGGFAGLAGLSETHAGNPNTDGQHPDKERCDRGLGDDIHSSDTHNQDDKRCTATAIHTATAGGTVGGTGGTVTATS